MLWYKAWMETRWRFLIGLALLMCSALAVIFAYPKVVRLMPMASSINTGGGLIGQQIREAIELSRNYRGYVWSQWFSQNLIQTWTLLATILGSGGLLAEASSGAALFTLSLPVSRSRILGTRAALGLGQLFALALVPSILIPLLSPAVGASYAVVDALVHTICLFVAGAVFFSLAFLLSTVFADFWRPLLISIGIAAALAVYSKFLPAFSIDVIRVMTGQLYFYTGALPWAGLALSAAASAAFLYCATWNIARHDF